MATIRINESEISQIPFTLVPTRIMSLERLTFGVGISNEITISANTTNESECNFDSGYLISIDGLDLKRPVFVEIFRDNDAVLIYCPEFDIWGEGIGDREALHDLRTSLQYIYTLYYRRDVHGSAAALLDKLISIM